MTPLNETRLAVQILLEDGEFHAKRDLKEQSGCLNYVVLHNHLRTIRRSLPEGTAIICELVQGRTVGYRMVTLLIKKS